MIGLTFQQKVQKVANNIVVQLERILQHKKKKKNWTFKAYLKIWLEFSLIRPLGSSLPLELYLLENPESQSLDYITDAVFPRDSFGLNLVQSVHYQCYNLIREEPHKCFWGISNFKKHHPQCAFHNEPNIAIGNIYVLLN